MENKVLLIAPPFFNYYKIIISELIEQGYEVDYYNERPGTGTLAKIIIRLNYRFYLPITRHYYKSLIKKQKNEDYKIILFVDPESVDRKSIIEMKLIFKKSVIIGYFWDSLRNKKSLKEKIDLFDRVYSFDNKDCYENNKLKFLPLFFSRFAEAPVAKKFIYDVTFVGTIHSDRYRIIKEIKKQCDSLGLKCFWFLYFPSKLLFYRKKFFDKSFKTAKITDFSFQPLTHNDVSKIIEQSKIIIDIEHPGQTGLTMRTIEMIGAQKKLITTNEDIKSYDFFKDSNIYIINRDTPCVDTNFFISEYKAIEKNIIDRYNISSWVKEIISYQQQS